MYYVAKIYNSLNPSIIMNFDKEEHAKQYADLMTKAGKGTYIVLKQYKIFMLIIILIVIMIFVWANID